MGFVSNGPLRSTYKKTKTHLDPQPGDSLSVAPVLYFSLSRSDQNAGQEPLLCCAKLRLAAGSRVSRKRPSGECHHEMSGTRHQHAYADKCANRPEGT